MSEKKEKLNIEKLRSLVTKIRNDPVNQARKEKIERYREYYRGAIWNPTSLGKNDTQAVMNYFFANIESQVPLLTDNRPMSHVSARKPFYQKIADGYNFALQAIWDRENMEDKIAQLVREGLIAGTSIFKVHFDPEKEDGKGDIVIEQIDENGFFVAPGTVDLWKTPYCGTVTQVPLSYLRGRYPDKADEIKAENDPEADVAEMHDTELDGFYATVYEMWMRDSEVVMEEMEDSDGARVMANIKKYPNGRIVVFTGDGVTLEDRPSPFNHGAPPYVDFHDYRMPLAFWGIGEIEMVEGLVKEYNLQLRYVTNHLRKYTNQVFVAWEESGITEDQFKIAMSRGDSLLLSKRISQDPGKIIQTIDMPPINDSVYSALAMLPRMIEEVSGVTDITKGVTGKKQRQSATELGILADTSSTRTRQRVRNLEVCLRKLTWMILELMQQFYAEGRTVSKVSDGSVQFQDIGGSKAEILERTKPANYDNRKELDDQDKEELAGMNPEEIEEDHDYEALVDYLAEMDEAYFKFDISIQANSTLPLDKQAQVNMALQLFAQQAIDQEAILDMVQFPNRQAILARMNQAQQAQAQAQGGGLPGMPPGGNMTPGGMM